MDYGKPSLVSLNKHHIRLDSYFAFTSTTSNQNEVDGSFQNSPLHSSLTKTDITPSRLNHDRCYSRNSSVCSSSSKKFSTTPALQSILSQRRQNSICSNTMSLSTSESTLSLFSYVSASSLEQHSYHSHSKLDSNFSHPLNNKASFVDWDLASSDCDEDDGTSFDYDSSFFLENDPLDISDILGDIDETFFDKKHVSHISPMSCKKTSIAKKPSLISNLSLSLRRITLSASNLLYSADEKVFSVQPRLTDDRLPSPNAQGQELTTFKITTSFPNTTTSTDHKSRESRINPEFLKLYAFETSARMKGLLKNVDQIGDTSSINLSKIKDRKLVLSLKVREKLWNNVVLPPRDDNLPVANNSNSEYVNENIVDQNDSLVSIVSVKNNSSLLTDGLKIKPWLQLHDLMENSSRSIKPKGYLNGNTQFTVKGWTNKKWIPIQH
ncbi:hypothetical protein WICPIJ_009031 [Wickerhamomyces pijperi]|uniref:Uncharacterized protein n=1 Tax=Wickerhamomyces pijperi TaxID=599730 RepID=A0A9P8PRU6_WICPI|nr:hypothetical protein WICPIJ_009031 [Wickerhamomyces pijperi]